MFIALLTNVGRGGESHFHTNKMKSKAGILCSNPTINREAKNFFFFFPSAQSEIMSSMPVEGKGYSFPQKNNQLVTNPAFV